MMSLRLKVGRLETPQKLEVPTQVSSLDRLSNSGGELFFNLVQEFTRIKTESRHTIKSLKTEKNFRQSLGV